MSIPTMAMFSSLNKFRTLCEQKWLEASQHPDEGVCQFSSQILAMSQSSDALLDHIANYLRCNSNTQSFWFKLNMSYDRDCHLASRFRLDPEDYEVVLPLVAPPSCRLVVPAGCRITSCRPFIAPPSRRLVAPAGCRIASRRPLIAPPSRHLVAPAGFRIASRRPLVAPPSRQLVAPACCRITSPLLVLSLRPACCRITPPRPLVAPTGCCIAS